MKYPYATIYEPTNQGIAHCCINYSENHSLSGSMFIIQCRKKARNMPLFDISNTSKIIGLNAENIIKYGGIQIK